MQWLDTFGASNALLPPKNHAEAEERLARVLAQLAVEDQENANSIAQHPVGRALLLSLCGHSPFLTKLLTKQWTFFSHLLIGGAEAAFYGVLGRMDEEAKAFTSKADVMQSLRIAKQQVALLTAIADMAAVWDVTQVTQTLTRFAEHTLSLSVDFLLKTGMERGEIMLPHPEMPSKDSGLIILGMGKLGGYELNYSSDVDLIIFADFEKVNYRGRQTPQHYMIGLARDLVSLMQDRTADGYVFRMDLRLRPDPASTPLVISIEAAMTYYESVGQNWERMALIKARPVAGDKHAAEEFLREIRPFIWRKHLDFAMIDDIHSIKRQIESTQTLVPDNLFGYNIKLGRGGIREIEFFAAIQQLIWGGRELDTRIAPTCKALAALCDCQKVTKQAAEELIAIYYYFRKLEHRLQMVEDEQTHSLPTTPEGLEQISSFMGYDTVEHFVEEVKIRLLCVQKHYSELCEESQPLGTSTGSLVFTGTENDPETVKNITDMGFSSGDAVAELIRGWHHGRTRATRNKRARELLTELTPGLLEAFSRTANPYEAFVKFDAFLGRLPAGAQIFSLLAQSTELLELIAEIMGSYPYLAENLSRKPVLLEYVFSQDFLDPLTDVEGLKGRLDYVLQDGHEYEDILNITRHWAHDRQFRIGVQLIKKLITPKEAREGLSDIAEAVLSVLLRHVKEEFTSRHGKIEGGAFAVIAMGKLGSRELSFGSDVDLVFIYDAPSMQAMSDGEKPLITGEYYTRLIRRFISAFSSLTSEGKLYDIDTRLRPSGNDGPVASSLRAFEQYYQETAWTWEFMALTKAKVIAGQPGLMKKIDAILQQTLSKSWDSTTLAKDIREIREKIAQQYPTSEPWAIKYVRGGLIDVEFIVQYLSLLHAKDRPEMLATNTGIALGKLGEAGILSAEDTQALVHAHLLLLDAQSILRLTSGDVSHHPTLSPGIKEELVRLRPEEDFATLETHLLEAQQVVKMHYERLLG